MCLPWLKKCNAGLLQQIRPDYIQNGAVSGENGFSTWIFRNLHVENFYFPRGEEKILRRNQMKLRRK